MNTGKKKLHDKLINRPCLLSLKIQYSLGIPYIRIGRMRDCTILCLFGVFRHQLCFLNFPKSCFPSPVLQKFINHQKNVSVQPWIAPFLVKCGGRESYCICGRAWLQYDWQPDLVTGQIQKPIWRRPVSIKRLKTLDFHCQFTHFLL